MSSNKTVCSIECAPECATCSGTDPAECLTCYSGTTLNSQTKTCESSVSTCNSTQTCSACPSGLIVYQRQCFECAYTDPNCLACTYEALNTCALCAYGFYLKNNACVAC